jgi:DNA-binding LacI/PurR family transcriptional regulator
MDPLLRLTIHSDSDIPLAQQLSRQLLWLIADGELPAGTRLPPVRNVAARLGINLHTVRAAYRMLQEDGLVITRQGLGTHVLPFDNRRLAQIAATFDTHTIGVIVPSMANPFYHAFLEGVEEAASANGTLVFLCNTHDIPSEAARYYAQMAARQVDGVIIASHDTTEFAPATMEESEGGRLLLPTIAVDWPGSAAPSVGLDLEDAGYEATRHLLEHGHRRLGLLTVDVEAANIRPVTAGYQRALAEAGQSPDPALVARAPGFAMAAGQAGARQLLALAQPPTAVFAISDTLALGALSEFKAAGLRIPDDIALVGFNDIPAAALVEPPLTTVAAPVHEMGARAMHMLQEQIAGRPLTHSHVTLPIRLVVRASCGPHP